MDEKLILDRALEVLKSKRAQGDAYLEHRRALDIQVREGKVEEVKRSEVRGLAVRAMLDSKLGFVHTSKLDPDSVAAATEKACELARFASPREDLILAEPSGEQDGRDEGKELTIYDGSLEFRPIEQKQEWARAAEAAARAVDPRITKTDGGGWSEGLTGIWIANTKGLYRHYRKSGISVGVGIAAEDKGEMQTGERSFDAAHWDHLPDPADLGQRAGERALRLLGGRPVPTGRYPVVFSPDGGFALLIYVGIGMSGDALSRGRSWLCDPLKENPELQLGSSLVTVLDDGRMPGRVGSVPFDAEGIDTGKLVLLDKGKVRGRPCDLASGKRLGIPSTGHSQRDGYESRPEIRAHNLHLAPGGQTPEELLAPISKGLWIWGLSGWWVGLDPSNPQFSSAAFGLWVENGKPVRPVARVTVAGSLREILEGIEAVGSDLVWDHPTKTPSFRVKELAVGGE